MELAVALPALLMVALIAFNAMTFFNQCAVFDREFRNAVRVHAVSPEQVTGASHLSAQIADSVAKQLGQGLKVRVKASQNALGMMTFTGTMEYAPTLFGRPFRGTIFSNRLPQVAHSNSYTVSCYRTGVIK